jgi:predicted phosphate transport protein (TIGR00153 family)
MPRLANLFAPREREFFDLFEASARNLVRSADLLDQMLRGFPDSKDVSRDILICEQEGDRLTHDIIQRLNHTFVTPIDREDIIALASALDDVVDFTEEVSDFLVLYKIEAPMEQSQRLAHILLEAGRQIDLAVPKMRTFDDITTEAAEIHRLENEGDRIGREGLAALFETGVDPMVVIRWKDIYDRLEEAIDATERAANVLQNIIVKNR